jgi:hypothetical protein
MYVDVEQDPWMFIPNESADVACGDRPVIMSVWIQHIFGEEIGVTVNSDNKGMNEIYL